MLSPISLVFLVVLCVLIGGTLLKLWLSRDKSAIWSPLTFICLTLIYYIVLPSISGLSLYFAGNNENQYLFYMASCLFYGSILIGFSIKTKSHFKRWNLYFNAENAKVFGICIFIFGLICYVPFRGFRTSIWAEDAYMTSSRTGLISYLIDLISLFCTACGLLMMSSKANNSKLKSWIPFFVVFYFTLIFYIVGGFRYRLVILLLSLATVYHLYPIPRKINLKLIIPIGVAAYLLFAIMDTARNYGTGIDREVAESLTLSQAAKGAGESADVCCFSIVAIDHYYKTGERVLFEPIVNAALMPIPRAFFPWKPDGEYMRTIQVKTIGSSEGGAACLSFAEGFASFGWFGVILYGLFMGWLAKLLWGNYKRNPQSMGAIILLAIFNGFCYQWISRGYLAGNFNDFIYFIIMPFWLTALFRKILPKSMLHE